MERMTIHRALAELKLIDAKITKQTSEIIPVGLYQKGKKINAIYEESDFKTSAESKFDSVNALIDRKIKIKSAVVTANGITQVTIGTKTMTIADAINYKSAIKFRKDLVNRIKVIYKGTVAELNKNNENVQAHLQNLLEVTFGKENVKVTGADMEAVSKPFLDANTVHLFDPLKAEETIETMEKEISDFETEVDATLSEVNATTFIEI